MGCPAIILPEPLYCHRNRLVQAIRLHLYRVVNSFDVAGTTKSDSENCLGLLVSSWISTATMAAIGSNSE
jgi:hypothetical protein